MLLRITIQDTALPHECYNCLKDIKGRTHAVLLQSAVVDLKQPRYL